MYEVICMFQDLQDFNHVYNVGDKFPRIGTKVSESRLVELSSNKNKRKKPLIKLIDEQKEVRTETSAPSEKNEPKIEDTTVNYTKTDINRLSKADLVDLAKSVGIEFTEETSGSELKTKLIERFNL